MGEAMRSSIRRGSWGVALVLALALGACQRDAAETVEPAAPTNAEREAEMANEQLAALGGPANANERALYEGEFQASGGIDALGGAEGAWELRLLTDYAQFYRPGLGEDGGITGERDYRQRGMRVVGGPLTITLMQQSCTASGVELPYTAHVLFEGVAYQGCARRGVEEGPRQTWASVLPDLVPAIDVCLARASAKPARVTFATAQDEGDVSVRVREADGSRRECVVNAGEVRVYETLSDEDRRPGESDPEFQRGGNRPRACAEAAVDRTGEQLGWLLARGC
jgi:uncharacterized membrane protein